MGRISNTEYFRTSDVKQSLHFVFIKLLSSNKSDIFTYNKYVPFESVIYTTSTCTNVSVALKVTATHTLKGGWMGGSRIRYSITKIVLIRDSISEISP